MCFQNKNQYDAALKLCKVCAGWFYFETDEEKRLAIESARAVVSAKAKEPMWYYNILSNTFDWVSALRDNHEHYTKLFDMAWTGKSTTDEKKSVVDNFLARLSAGYEGDPYIDGEIASILEQQSAKYSDAKWTTKIKVTLGRYSI